MVILEELEHARRRGATIYAEVAGYGTTADAFRVTDSHPEGRGAIACIAMALKDSGLAPQDIGYINAHGTSTQVNDRVETVAIKKVLGEAVYQIPVSSRAAPPRISSTENTRVRSTATANRPGRASSRMPPRLRLNSAQT